jgi:hypothetical protein
MIDLYNNDTNALIGSISDEELRALLDGLEEESSTDQDYYLDQDTIDLLAEEQASEHLLQLLRAALGTEEGVEIRWQRR